MRAKSRDVILLVGMHRSGTSALTRVLSLCGAALPLRVMSPNRGNPTGYWEPQRAVELNDFYLRAHSSSWYDPSLRLQTQSLTGAMREDFVAQIAAFLVAGFEAGGAIVLKDPRITALLPYWIAAANKLRLSAKIIHIFRNCAEVASSLAHRDGLAGDHSAALWLKYNLVAERDARGLQRIFVSYEDFLGDWESVLARCVADLQLDIVVREEARSTIAEFLSPDLRHHRGALLGPSTIDPDVTDWLSETQSALRCASAGVSLPSIFDAIFEEYMASGHAERYS